MMRHPQSGSYSAYGGGVQSPPNTYGSYPMNENYSPQKQQYGFSYSDAALSQTSTFGLNSQNSGFNSFSSQNAAFKSQNAAAFNSQNSGQTQQQQPQQQGYIESNQDIIETTHLDGTGGKAALPWLEKHAIEQRIVKLQLDANDTAAFMKKCEFISLGCFCGVTRALQCLGLKSFSYPFDWVRSDTAGVVTCLESQFEGFCTSSYEGSVSSPGVQCRGDTDWGGSFWHHDPSNAKVQNDFSRRIQRFRGLAEVHANQARVFCISLNSLDDLAAIPLLQMRLESMFPRAEVYLLVFVDNQPAKGPVHVACDSRNTLFHWVYEDMFSNAGAEWSEQKHAEAYAEGIASAIHFWLGIEDEDGVPEVESYMQLYERCYNFQGRDPTRSLYWPERQPKGRTPQIVMHGRGRGAKLCLVPWPLDYFLRPCGAAGEDDPDSDIEMVHSAKQAAGHSDTIKACV